MKKSKSLLIFIPSIENGGVEKNLYLVANYLAKKNVSVKILTSFNNNRKFFDKRIKIISLKNIIRKFMDVTHSLRKILKPLMIFMIM